MFDNITIAVILPLYALLTGCPAVACCYTSKQEGNSEEELRVIVGAKSEEQASGVFRDGCSAVDPTPLRVACATAHGVRTVS